MCGKRIDLLTNVKLKQMHADRRTTIKKCNEPAAQSSRKIFTDDVVFIRAGYATFAVTGVFAAFTNGKA
jgi:hypothetical protein